MRMTIYLPDELAGQVKTELKGFVGPNRTAGGNISAVCQDALRAELERVRARARLAAEDFGRVEAYDSEADRHVAFQGREVGSEHDHQRVVYLTPKSSLVLVNKDTETFEVYACFADFAANWGGAGRLAAEVAAALGEKYVEELDI